MVIAVCSTVLSPSTMMVHSVNAALACRAVRHPRQFPSFTLITVFLVETISLVVTIILFVADGQPFHNRRSWIRPDCEVIRSNTSDKKKWYVALNNLSNWCIWDILVEVLKSANKYKVLQEKDTHHHGIYVNHYLHELYYPIPSDFVLLFLFPSLFTVSAFFALLIST